MNVYDFDGTLYDTDCSISFGFWCMNHHPKLWFTYFPGIIKSFVKYKLKMIPNYRLQRELFRYLTLVDDFDEQIERYWDVYEKRISSWYLEQKQPDDLIISSSPRCIIEPITRRLGVTCAATDYDRELGVFVDNLMYAKEKARYIIDHGFPVIDNFYSDSMADTPIALCAEKAYLVTNKATTLNEWPHIGPDLAKKVKKKIDTGWIVHLREG
jgi:phosphoserine phosphatase